MKQIQKYANASKVKANDDRRTTMAYDKTKINYTRLRYSVQEREETWEWWTIKLPDTMLLLLRRSVRIEPESTRSYIDAQGTAYLGLGVVPEKKFFSSDSYCAIAGCWRCRLPLSPLRAYTVHYYIQIEIDVDKAKWDRFVAKPLNQSCGRLKADSCTRWRWISVLMEMRTTTTSSTMMTRRVRRARNARVFQRLIIQIEFSRLCALSDECWKESMWMTTENNVK